MAVYAVFEPPLKEDAGADETMERALRFKFVRDGFSFWAFLLGPVWMLFHRLWLALICYIVLIFAITLVAFSFGLAEGAVTIASLLIALLLGFAIVVVPSGCSSFVASLLGPFHPFHPYLI